MAEEVDQEAMMAAWEAELAAEVFEILEGKYQIPGLATGHLIEGNPPLGAVLAPGK